ncbi:hypothetical protein DID87_02275 [Fructilactobacillus sanfranciscensis]|uniref:LysM domain-containing protein n=1 Tax=Fructilactobacillus sanfranciscensis TaxID=1625 RepID=A0A5C4TLK0_FRUSA|nr:LysM domain-containing protein [Fructilactobacillus sanfranciscensis]TNK90775.1 hypothetical protein DID87_02275 [Fructilactobacillus sanfranciscensis]
MKFKGLKTIAAVTAVSAGVLFAGANSANASTRVTVKSGDTISELAKTYNISMQSIKDANNIQDINKIYVGEVGGSSSIKLITIVREKKISQLELS